MLVDEVAEDLSEVVDDCGLFEVFDAHQVEESLCYDGEPKFEMSHLQNSDVTTASERCSWSDRMSTLVHLVPKALATSGVVSMH